MNLAIRVSFFVILSRKSVLSDLQPIAHKKWHCGKDDHWKSPNLPNTCRRPDTSCRYSVNTLRPRHNGRHFPDIFKCIFLNENIWIYINISLKFAPKGPINNILALVQIMALCRPGDKPLFEPVMVRLPTHICVNRPQWVNVIFPYNVKLQFLNTIKYTCNTVCGVFHIHADVITIGAKPSVGRMPIWMLISLLPDSLPKSVARLSKTHWVQIPGSRLRHKGAFY